MKEYIDHYVAFIDILGFKSILATLSCDEVYPIFDVLETKTKASLNFNGVQIDAYNHIKHIILSDSIIIFIPSHIDDAFAALVDVCHRLQISLANRETPILLRGGIAKGGLFYEGNIIYGEGLTKAYLLESNLAKYPRIVFSGETLSTGKENAKYLFPELDHMGVNYITDKDHLHFVNYLPYLCEMKIDEVVEYCDRLRRLYEYWLNKEIDFTLREKYIWLKEKLESQIKCMPAVKKIYDDRLMAELDKNIAEYNARFAIYSKKQN